MPRPPTVLHLLNASDAGGLTKYVIDVGAATKTRGWRVIVACDRGAWHERLVASGLEVLPLPLMCGLSGFFRSAATLRRFCKAEGVDLIHSHYRRATRCARLAQRRGSPPILYTLHLSHLNVAGWRRWLSDFGDHTHVASEDARQWIVNEAHADPRRVSLVPHGVDIDRWPETTTTERAAARAELGLHDDDAIAAFVGRLDEQKQPDWSVEAIVRAAQSHPRVALVVVGDGPMRPALEQQLKSRGGGSADRAPRVLLLGERDPLIAYRAADLLLSSSWREGFGYAPAEALATGLPVLRTRTSGTHETIVEGVTGRSVPIDKAIFIDAVTEMLTDVRALAAMRAGCAVHARSHLRFDQQIESTLALYKRMTQQVRPGSIDR